MTHAEEEQPIEQCPDPIDSASLIEAAALRENIAQVQWASRPQQLPRDDGTYAVTDCDECGNDIGEVRLRIAPKNLMCVGCAAAQEVEQKRRR
jgi:RNA polymerase-binding transcription factor DksA